MNWVLESQEERKMVKIMIRFCDKEVYTIHCGDMTRTQMLMFFLNTDRMGVIVIYDEYDHYYGMTDYYKILKNVEEQDYILKEYFIVDDSFWNNAREFFQKKPNELVPVLNKNGTMLGFCYNDDKEDLILKYTLEIIESVKDVPVSLFDYYEYFQQVCITDCNEWAYRLYCVFRRLNYPICVLGEKWGWFGIPQLEGYYHYPEYAKLYIYAEGSGEFRRQRFNVPVYSSVMGNFFFIARWAIANLNKINNQMIAKLINKEISVCKVLLPKREDISYFTDTEMAGFFISADPTIGGGGLIDDSRNELREKIAVNIIGKQSYDKTEKGRVLDRCGYKKVTYNKVCAEIREDIDYQKRIYVIGHCIVGGSCLSYQEMLTSQLQNKIINSGYAVARVSVRYPNFDMIRTELERLPIRKGDIVLFIDDKEHLIDTNVACPSIDLTDIYNNQDRKTWLYGYDSRHLNGVGNEAVAQAIYDRFLKDEMARLNREVTDHSYVQKGEVLSEELQHDVFEYVKNVKNWNRGVAGCIVMNCNPFTLGHQYLIEYAAKQVDKLYLFVVEENRSFFTFEERFEMVRKGTEHLANVHVVPSGEWVLSFKTLPVYFEKAKMQEEKVDAQMDLEIFARYIAPALGIKKRFVGEEPTDKVTRQYNEQMKRILNEFDIEVEEIPRKEMNGRPISASYVRKCIEEECYEELKEYIPESTYTALRLNR